MELNEDDIVDIQDKMQRDKHNAMNYYGGFSRTDLSCTPTSRLKELEKKELIKIIKGHRASLVCMRENLNKQILENNYLRRGIIKEPIRFNKIMAKYNLKVVRVEKV